MDAGNPGLQYLWSTGETSQSISIDSSGSYSVTVTNQGICSDADTVNIIIHSLPNVVINSMAPVCENTPPFVLSGGTPQGGTYTGNGVTGNTFTPTTPGTFTIVYSFTDTNNCVNSASAYLVVNSAPVAFAGNDTMVCHGSSITLTATGGIAYLWNHGITQGITFVPVSTTTYNVTVTDGNNCSSVDSVKVTVDPGVPVSVSITANDTSICEGTDVIFTAFPLNGGNSPTYHWFLNGNTVGSNSDTYSNNNLADGDDVYCILISSETCAANNPDTSGTIIMTVTPGVAVSVNITADPGNAVCDGTEITFTADPVVNGGTNPNIQWYQNGVLIGSGITITRTVSDNGDIILCIMTSNFSGCLTNNPDTATMVVQTYPLPIISFNTTNEKCLGAGDGAIQTTATNGSPPYTYLWSNGLSVATINSLQPGTYSVEVTDARLCKSTKEIEVGAAADACLYIPNIFSPNSDGKNDKLYVRGSGIKYLEFTIYDRWGNKIFESNEQNIGWDGCYNGSPMNAAVFVYTLKAEMISGSIIEEKGNVTLIR
ncbi:MAG: gliding motility-associated C-terminal domain-containing protein [Bacteroidia bacterium]|nr:gliding motility-associated C-terminal domain-containing protein [Bacteroidia bacterium]